MRTSAIFGVSTRTRGVEPGASADILWARGDRGSIFRDFVRTTDAFYGQTTDPLQK